MIVDLHCGDLCFGKDLKDSRKNQGRTNQKEETSAGRAYQKNSSGKRSTSLIFQGGVAPTRRNPSGRRHEGKWCGAYQAKNSGRRHAMKNIYKFGLSDFDS